MYYHPFEEDSKKVITDYEVEKLKELTECINEVCNDLGIKVKDFANLLQKYSTSNDAYNAYVEILEYASQKTDCYAVEDFFFRKVTFEPEDCHFGVWGSRLNVDVDPYLNRIIERFKED